MKKSGGGMLFVDWSLLRNAAVLTGGEYFSLASR